MAIRRIKVTVLRFLFPSLLLLLTLPAPGQQSSSSSSSNGQIQDQPTSHLGQRRTEAAGAAITLETSEPLFQVATALNACGYDSDLAGSNPVRAQVRDEVAETVRQSAAAQQAHKTLCQYVAEHQLNDRTRSVAQYISLALFLGPAPQLVPTADETELPPDALAVVNVLPALRAFATAVNLHAIWLKRRPQYDAITDAVHDPVTAMVLNTNVYLKVPATTYDGRRLLILVEPMLAPNAPNARIYSNDYVVITSPTPSGSIKLDQIRHLYLHFEIEPLVYARAQSIQRLLPLLKPMQAAPVDFVYKADVLALVTECLIKAIEARTLDIQQATGAPLPLKPKSKARIDLARYDEEMTGYNRTAEAARRKVVDLDMRQGWILADYFYQQLQSNESSPESLTEEMGQMVYGMDVAREADHAKQIAFLPETSGDFVRRVNAAPSPLMAAEKKLISGDLAGAQTIADQAIANPRLTPSEKADALYVRARVELMQNKPEASVTDFKSIIRQSNNPRTVAWAHIYLGRLYDIQLPEPDRDSALTEYRAALAVPAAPQETQAAAKKGLAAPFVVPRQTHRQEEEVDPSGKAEKDSYKPE